MASQNLIVFWEEKELFFNTWLKMEKNRQRKMKLFYLILKHEYL